MRDLINTPNDNAKIPQPWGKIVKLNTPVRHFPLHSLKMISKCPLDRIDALLRAWSKKGKTHLKWGETSLNMSPKRSGCINVAAIGDWDSLRELRLLIMREIRLWKAEMLLNEVEQLGNSALGRDFDGNREADPSDYDDLPF